MAAPPRITEQDVAIYGGSLTSVIEGCLEAVRHAPMEDKEKAVRVRERMRVTTWSWEAQVWQSYQTYVNQMYYATCSPR